MFVKNRVMGRKSYIITGLLWIVFLGCYPDENEFDEQLIQNKIATTIKSAEEQYRLTCFNNLLYEAEVFSDSLVIQQIAYSINDSIYFPLRPDRPLFPHPITLDDSTVIYPVLNDSIISKIKQRSAAPPRKEDTSIILENDKDSL